MAHSNAADIEQRPAPAPGDVEGALLAAISALLSDKDVSEIDTVEGGLVEILRRGRRERLETLIEGPLFELLRDHGAGAGLVAFVLRDGSRLDAMPLVDGRVALSVKKAPPTDASLAHLVEEGLLPAGVPAELEATVWSGTGVLFLGPSRTGRQRAVVALARALAPRLRLGMLSEPVVAGTLPPPGGSLQERAVRAQRLGVDVLVAIDLTVEQLRSLLPLPPTAPLIASVQSPAMAALQANTRDHPLEGVAGLMAVIGHAPDGRPRLIEMHGGVGEVAAATTSVAPVPAPSPPAPAAAPPAWNVPAPSWNTGGRGPREELPALPALESPPAEWGGPATGEDPGWELGSLGSLPPTKTPMPGAFDAALQAAAKRPAFQPHAPEAHPQARALRGTGGLTLEPPGGTPDEPQEEG